MDGGGAASRHGAEARAVGGAVRNAADWVADSGCGAFDVHHAGHERRGAEEAADAFVEGRRALDSCVAIAAAFLLPPTVIRFSPFGEYDRQLLAKSLYLAFGELTMLLVGILGFALR